MLISEMYGGRSVDQAVLAEGFGLSKTDAEQGYGLAMMDPGQGHQFAIGCKGSVKTPVKWMISLEIIRNPELAERTALFKAIGEQDEHWGEDYEGGNG